MAAYPANATQTKMQIYSASRAVDRDPITDKSRDWKSNANVSSSQIAASPIGEKKRKKKIPSALTPKQIHSTVFPHLTQKFTRQRRVIERRTETGRPAACCIGQECRCHGNRQPRVGIWSGRWSYCRGFRVQHASGRSAHMVLSSLLSIPFISDSSDPAALLPPRLTDPFINTTAGSVELPKNCIISTFIS